MVMANENSSRSARLLAAYDAQLRREAETAGAATVTDMGPLLLVTFAGGDGFVTYRDFGDLSAEEIQRLVPGALSYFQNDAAIARVEWKTRGHDRAEGLSEALLANDFIRDEQESIMIGDAQSLAVDVQLPNGVTVRQVTEESDVRAMCAMQNDVFGGPVNEELANSLLHRLSLADGMELWVGESNGEIVAAGRLDPVPNSDFAGIRGGATRAEWRGRGIYRALTAARARSAIRLGKTLIHSDSTDDSRPILEKSGLIAVSSTTPYRWSRQLAPSSRS